MASHFLHWDDVVAEGCRNGAVAIGNFDGVHRGHQEIVAELQRQGRALSGPAIAVTFDPHPLQILRPELFQPLLTTVARRAELLHQHGADHVLILATTPDLLHLRAAEFFDQVIRDRLDARVLVEGPNFGFGRNREGNIDTLRSLCLQAGRRLVVVPPLEREGKVVSSSRVRNELVHGAVSKAADLLGRPFRLAGTVGKGQGRGQTLGFPTANLEGITTLVPGNGVYAGRALVGEHAWAGAANIGPNPTFGEQARKIEVHLIDFHGDLYGQTLAMDFLERLRDTRPFPSPQDLAAQLRVDVERTRKVVGIL